MRQFDRWYAAVSIKVDYVANDSGFFINFWPEGLGSAAADSERLQSVFQ